MNNPFETLSERLTAIENLLYQIKENGLNEIKTEIDEHFTISELASFLHCSIGSVHNKRKDGMPSFKNGRIRLFSKKEVLAFMKEPLLKKSKGKN